MHYQIKSYGQDLFKYVIGYRHKGNVFPSPLYIKLPQMNAYTKYFDKNNKYINLLVSDKKILEKYSEIWNKIKSLIKKNWIVNQCIMINTLKLK